MKFFIVVFFIVYSSFCMGLTNSEKLIDKTIPKLTNRLIERAESGSLEDRYSLALAYMYSAEDRTYNRDWEIRARTMFEELAKEGHVPSMYVHGYQFVHHSITGNDRFTKNEGFRWIEEAAKEGYPPALFEMGKYYLYELAIHLDITDNPQDFDRAYDYFSEAALQGSRSALFELAKIFFNGWGVRKNLEKSYLFYQQAAQKGLYSAYARLAYEWHDRDGLEPNEELFQKYESLFKNNDRHDFCGEDEEGIDIDCGDRRYSWLYSVFLYHGEFIFWQ